jgi:hypothetical protein
MIRLIDEPSGGGSGKAFFKIYFGSFFLSYIFRSSTREALSVREKKVLAYGRTIVQGNIFV